MTRPGVTRCSLFVAVSILGGSLAVAGFGGCGRLEPGRGSAGDATGHETLPAVSQPGPPTREDVRSAMLSVYFHAYGLDLLPTQPRSRLPVKPIPLGEAAGILKRDPMPGANARRRRAISKLVAGLVLRAQPGDVHGALEVLVPNPLQLEALIREGRDAVPPTFTRHLPLPFPVLPIEHPIRGIIAQIIASVLLSIESEGVPDAKRECCSGVQVCEVDPASDYEEPAQVRFEILVRRGVQELRKSIDPQDWDACVPDYFQDTHYAAGTCSAAPTSSSIAAPAPGSGWDGALYEHYQAEFDSGTTFFKNNLQICGDWNASQEIYRYHYALCRPGGSLSSQVLDYPVMEGGLKKDCGILLAWDNVPGEDAPDHSSMRGIKQLQYATRDHEDPGLIPWTNLGLEVLVDEMADTAVCCGASSDAEDCKIVDEQCIQAAGSSKGWKLPVPACQITEGTSPPCAAIEN